MSELEKMVSGQVYNPADPELRELHFKAADLCAELNASSVRDTEKRSELFKKLFGRAGSNLNICQNFLCDYGFNIFIGDDVFINYNCVMLDCAPISIGRNVLIGPDCGLYTAVHPVNPEERKKGTETAEPIKIGDNVWLGGRVTVLPGVSIGDNCVIGAGSVVVRDIPAGTAAVGNPCRVIKHIENSEYTANGDK